MLKSFNHIFGFLIGLTVVGFGVVFTAICLLLVYFLFDNAILWYIPTFIFGIVISIFIGSFVHVVLSIPFKLSQEYDAIKNKVALNEYQSLQEFQEEVACFMIRFFNFKGVDIIGGKFHFEGCNTTIKDCDVDFAHLTKADFTKYKIRLKGNHKAFYLPIDLGNRHLGSMILITKGYTLPIFYSILQDFENYYLDDQLMILTGKTILE